MADSKGLNLAPLLERLGQNPAAIGLLGQLLGGGGDGDATAAAAPAHSGEAVPGTDERDGPPERHAKGDAGSIPASVGGTGVLLPPPPGRDHGRGRRDVLIALRPFLSSRRCASVDRLLRALELYEVIEDSRR